MNKNVLRSSIIAFLAAIICVTGFIRIMVPGLQSGIVIQNAMCILTAVLLGGLWGAAPSALFFFAGVIGLPVFAGWKGGFSVLMDINGGYRIGWVMGALTAGLISGSASVAEKKTTVKYVIRLSIAVFAGMLALYLPEVFYVIGYKSSQAFDATTLEKLGMDVSLAGQQIGVAGALKIFFSMFFAPFLLVDSIKAVLVILLSIKIRPIVAQYLFDSSEKQSEAE